MKKLVVLATALVAALAVAQGKKPDAKPADAKPADAKAAFKITGDAAKGQVKFKELCVSCHGEKGAGDGAAAAALNPKPANFTDAKRAAEVTDEYIYNMIKEGGAANGKSALMASWKGALNEAQLMDVAAYVRSLSKGGAAAPAPAAAPAKDAKPAGKK
ncbi:MAG: cytochrome c [Myxococcaceae bacterium]|jgi:mono/diheme cytochrome c family protein|nr:cytochrome c [Myxococcaceae bacterium]